MRFTATCHFRGKAGCCAYTKTFVSMKYLALIHLFAREVPVSWSYVLEAMNQRSERGSPSGTRRIMLEPLAECGIQRFVFRLSDAPRLLDQRFISAESNVFHTGIVYTILVRRHIP